MATPSELFSFDESGMRRVVAAVRWVEAQMGGGGTGSGRRPLNNIQTTVVELLDNELDADDLVAAQLVTHGIDGNSWTVLNADVRARPVNDDVILETGRRYPAKLSGIHTDGEDEWPVFLFWGTESSGAFAVKSYDWSLGADGTVISPCAQLVADIDSGLDVAAGIDAGDARLKAIPCSQTQIGVVDLQTQTLGAGVKTVQSLRSDDFVSAGTAATPGSFNCYDTGGVEQMGFTGSVSPVSSIDVVGGIVINVT